MKFRDLRGPIFFELCVPLPSPFYCIFNKEFSEILEIWNFMSGSFFSKGSTFMTKADVSDSYFRQLSLSKKLFWYFSAKIHIFGDLDADTVKKYPQCFRCLWRNHPSPWRVLPPQITLKCTPRGGGAIFQFRLNSFNIYLLTFAIKIS